MVTIMVNLWKGNKRYERGAPGRVARGFIIEQLPKRFSRQKHPRRSHLLAVSTFTQSNGAFDSFMKADCVVMCVSCLHCSVFQHRARMEMCLPGKNCFQPTRHRAQHAAQLGHLQLSTEACAFLRTHAVWDADLWPDPCVPEGRRAVENLIEARKSSNL